MLMWLMKRMINRQLILCGLICFTNPLCAQVKQDSIGSSEIILVAEQPPHFPGGQTELMKFVSSNLKYPQEARKSGIQGKVFISFVVERDGTIKEESITIEKSVHPLLDNEAVRIVKMMPEWIPANQKGRTVRCKTAFPILFALKNKRK